MSRNESANMGSSPDYKAVLDKYVTALNSLKIKFFICSAVPLAFGILLSLGFDFKPSMQSAVFQSLVQVAAILFAFTTIGIIFYMNNQ